MATKEQRILINELRQQIISLKLSKNSLGIETKKTIQILQQQILREQEVAEVHLIPLKAHLGLVVLVVGVEEQVVMAQVVLRPMATQYLGL